VVAVPAQVPTDKRIPGRYPPMAVASILGGTRSPVAVRPDPAKPGRYSPLRATLYLGWDGNQTARQRYDFPFGSQIYLQTAEQRASNDTGAMITILPPPPSPPIIPIAADSPTASSALPPELLAAGGLRNAPHAAPGASTSPTAGRCFCEQGVAGNMHIDAFVPHEALDPLDLPPAEGGVAYLGRVRLSPIDDGSNRTVLADHWMKWAFHFLVDADPASPSYMLPLRLYGHLGVRQIFHGWMLGDPAIDKPDVWTIPDGCQLLAKACHAFK